MADPGPKAAAPSVGKLPKFAWLALRELIIELLIGALLAIGAAGFSYAFIKRAFLSESRELIDEDAPDSTHITALPADEAAAPHAGSGAIYPLPDSQVIGQGESGGFVDTLVGWGFSADGLLEIREDVPNSRARFYPLHKQTIEHARLRDGRRYVWRVLADSDDLRQKTIAGPYRFTLRARP